MFIVKQGDLFPPIDATVRDANDAVVDVSGATVKFSMRDSRDPGSIKIALGTGQVVDGVTGAIRYAFGADDSDTPGTYEAEFQVTPTTGASMRIPTEGYITVIIEEAVA
jgi:hypothetical protein